MAVIRESVTIDPISTEELDIEGNIHRYNFGWMVTRTIVGGSNEGGIVVESSSTGIAGNASVFEESVTQTILPPSITLPEGVGTVTSMDGGVELGTYYKFGTKKRTYTKSRVFGTSELVVMGESAYSITENKIYANSSGGGVTISPGAGGGAHADGGAQYVAANGVMTITDIKG